MVIWLERGADMHMPQLMPLPLMSLASVKSRLVLPFWYRLTRVVPEKGPLNGCVCVCVSSHREQKAVTNWHRRFSVASTCRYSHRLIADVDIVQPLNQ